MRQTRCAHVSPSYSAQREIWCGSGRIVTRSRVFTKRCDGTITSVPNMMAAISMKRGGLGV